MNLCPSLVKFDPLVKTVSSRFPCVKVSFPFIINKQSVECHCDTDNSFPKVLT